jgi:hypothetical protein
VDVTAKYKKKIRTTPPFLTKEDFLKKKTCVARF